MGRRIRMILAILALMALVAAAGGYYWLIRRPLPQTAGTIRLPGLGAPVKVLRDRWGVPHIYATNIHDLLMAQGFVHAQDRMWQMETNRRLVAGRLSEILGAPTLALDRLVRTYGFMRAARREVASYDAAARRMIEAYAAGVNAWIDGYRGNLPLEFRLLRVDPEPWHPEDSIAWGKFIAFSGSKNWQEEFTRVLLTDKLGADRAGDLLARVHSAAPPIVPAGIVPASLLTPAAGPVLPLALAGGASNNWSVHGSRTATGAPLLANDMHLPLRIPSVWYEVHLTGGGLDVIGLSLVGLPLVIAGHNPDLAWGITFAYTDNQDLYYERLDPDGGRYLFKNRWLPVERITETIRVKGRPEPVVHTVRLTRHGPLISDSVAAVGDRRFALALRWAAHDPGDMIATAFDLQRARNWHQFKNAAQRWSEPCVNLAYADRQGNIGYVLASRVPLRARGHGMGPFEGWTGADEWTGELAPEEKPFVLNPPAGFVVTANNQVTGDDYPHYIAVDYASGHRAQRIAAVLAAARPPISAEDMGRLQGDYHSLMADEMLAALAGAAEAVLAADPLWPLLRDWDRTMAPDSAGAAVYAVLFQRLLENTVTDELGDVSDRFLGKGMTYLEPLTRFVEHSRVILLSLLAEPDSAWFDDVRTGERETLDHVLARSLKETRIFLEKTLGPDPATWRWGRLHTVTIPHPLGRVKPLDRIFNIGPFEGGGHFETVWQSAVTPGMDFALNGWSVSNRHVYDPADWDRSVGSIVPGQSGMFGSPHYADQVPLWQGAGHHPLWYSRDRVTAAATSTLQLVP